MSQTLTKIHTLSGGDIKVLGNVSAAGAITGTVALSNIDIDGADDINANYRWIAI